MARKAPSWPTPPAGLPPDADYRADRGLWLQIAHNPERAGSEIWRWWTAEGVLAEQVEHRVGLRHGLARFFHDNGRLRQMGSYEADGRVGRWSFWNECGVLVREAEFKDDELDGVDRRYGSDRKRVEESCYIAGIRHGPYWSRVAAGHFVDRLIRAEEGLFEDGLPVGEWRFYDDDGGFVRAIDLGIVRSDPDLQRSPVFEDIARPPADWLALADGLLFERRTGEALCAAARSLAGSGDIAAWKRLWNDVTVPLAKAPARDMADDAVRRAPRSLPLLLATIARGAGPSELLRAMSIILSLGQRPRVALDLGDAALALSQKTYGQQLSR